MLCPLKVDGDDVYLSKFNFLIPGSLESGRTSVPPPGSQLIITRIPMGTHNTEIIPRGHGPVLICIPLDNNVSLETWNLFWLDGLKVSHL